MTTAVSKLFAEIGFKINEGGLKEFSKDLSNLQKQIESVSKALRELPNIKIRGVSVNTSVSKDISKQVEQQANRELKEKAKQEEKERKEREKAERRALRERQKMGREFLRGITAVSATLVSALKTGLGIAGTQSTASMQYGDYTRLTGGSIPELQRFQALAAATGAGLSRSDMYSQLVGLRERYNQLLLAKGDTTPFKFLGLRAEQNPAEMMAALIQSYKESPNKELSLSIMRQMGLSAEAIGRMANATPEQLERARRLQEGMLTPDQLKVMQETGSIFYSLKERVEQLKDVFTLNFADAIKDFYDFLNDKEIQEGMKSFGILLKGLVKAVSFVIKVFYKIGKELGYAVGSAVSNTETGVKALEKQNYKFSLADSAQLSMMGGDMGMFLISKGIQEGAGKNFVDARQISITVDDKQKAIDIANGVDDGTRMMSFPQSFLDGNIQGVQ